MPIELISISRLNSILEAYTTEGLVASEDVCSSPAPSEVKTMDKRSVSLSIGVKQKLKALIAVTLLAAITASVKINLSYSHLRESS